jgi:hypothetical protein
MIMNDIVMGIYEIYVEECKTIPLPFEVWAAEAERAADGDNDYLPNWDDYRVYYDHGGRDAYSTWLFRRHGVNQ